MGDYQFHIIAAGAEGNPAVLLLHGFMGRGQDWREVMEGLGNQFYCLAPDVPGHGKTEVLEGEDAYTMREICEGLTVALRGIKQDKVDMIGYSMGGRLALYFALRYPELIRRVVIESGSPGIADEAERAARQEQDEALARRLETEPFEQFVREWYEQPLFATIKQDPERFAQLIEQRREQDPRELARSLRGMGTGAQESLWGELDKTPPTLLIVGEEDAKFKGIAAEMAMRMPKAEIATVAGAGHNVHFEAPGRYVELVNEFLSR